MWRRDGRTAWMPAFLLWIPVLLLGLVMTFAIDIDVDPVGDDHRVVVQMPAPAAWADEPVRFGIGLALLVAGLVLFGLANWQPAPGRIPGVAAVYPWFLTAAVLLSVALVFALLSRQGDAFDFSGGAAQWRFLVDLRGGTANRITQGVLVSGVLLSTVASFGRAQALEGPRLVEPVREPPTEPPEDAPVTS